MDVGVGVILCVLHSIRLSRGVNCLWVVFVQKIDKGLCPRESARKYETGSRGQQQRSNVWCPRGVMVKAMNCGIVVREFVLQSRYYVHVRASTLGKGMNPLILPPAMGK